MANKDTLQLDVSDALKKLSELISKWDALATAQNDYAREADKISSVVRQSMGHMSKDTVEGFEKTIRKMQEYRVMGQQLASQAGFGNEQVASLVRNWERVHQAEAKIVEIRKANIDGADVLIAKIQGIDAASRRVQSKIDLTSGTSQTDTLTVTRSLNERALAYTKLAANILDYQRNLGIASDTEKQKLAASTDALARYIQQQNVLQSQVARIAATAKAGGNLTGVADQGLVSRILAVKNATEQLGDTRRRSAAAELEANRQAIYAQETLLRLTSQRARGGTTGEQAKLSAAMQAVAQYAGKAKITVDELNRAIANPALPSSDPRIVALNRYVAAYKSALQNIGAEQRKQNDQLFVGFKQASNLLQSSLLYRSVSSLYSGLSGSVGDAATFSQLVGNIQTIDRANLSTQAWRDSLFQLSNAFGVDVVEQARAAYEALSNQVVTGADAALFMAEANKLAAIGMSSVTDSVNILSSVINAYGLTASDANEISAKLFKAMEIGRFRIGDIGNTFGRVTIIANQLGISLDEVLAFMGRFTIQGLPASEAMTQLRNIMNKLIQPTKEMKKVLADVFGVASGQQAIALYGTVGVFEKLAEVTQGLPEEIAKIVNTIRGQSGMISTLNEMGEFKSALDKISSSVSEYGDRVSLVLRTTGRQYAQLTQTLRNEFIRGGEEAITVIGNLHKALEGTGGIVGTARTAVIAFLASMAVTRVTAFVQALRAANVAAFTLSGTLKTIAPLAVIAGITYVVTQLLEMESAAERAAKAMEQIEASAARATKSAQESAAALKKRFEETLTAAYRRVELPLAKEIARLNTLMREAPMDLFFRSLQDNAQLTSQSIRQVVDESRKLLSQMESETGKINTQISNLRKQNASAALDAQLKPLSLAKQANTLRDLLRRTSDPAEQTDLLNRLQAVYTRQADRRVEIEKEMQAKLRRIRKESIEIERRREMRGLTPEVSGKRQVRDEYADSDDIETIESLTRDVRRLSRELTTLGKPGDLSRDRQRLIADLEKMQFLQNAAHEAESQSLAQYDKYLTEIARRLTQLTEMRVKLTRDAMGADSTAEFDRLQKELVDVNAELERLTGLSKLSRDALLQNYTPLDTAAEQEKLNAKAAEALTTKRRALELEEAQNRVLIERRQVLAELDEQQKRLANLRERATTFESARLSLRTLLSGPDVAKNLVGANFVDRTFGSETKALLTKLNSQLQQLGWALPRASTDSSSAVEAGRIAGEVAGLLANVNKDMADQFRAAGEVLSKGIEVPLRDVINLEKELATKLSESSNKMEDAATSAAISINALGAAARNAAALLSIQPARLAHGGAVGSDRIPALLAPGEMVVNAKQTRSMYSQLVAMNSGPLQRYNNGGSVTNVGDIHVHYTNNKDINAAQIAKDLRRAVRTGRAKL